MIIEIILATILTYKGSQSVNLATGGTDGLTLTEQSYQDCEKDNTNACIQKGIYTVAFFPVDVIATTITGRPDLIGNSHGKIWHEIDKKLPTITHVRTGGYGGSNWVEFMDKRR
jgi:hypothetical protein